MCTLRPARTAEGVARSETLGERKGIHARDTLESPGKPRGYPVFTPSAQGPRTSKRGRYCRHPFTDRGAGRGVVPIPTLRGSCSMGYVRHTPFAAFRQRGLPRVTPFGHSATKGVHNRNTAAAADRHAQRVSVGATPFRPATITRSKPRRSTSNLTWMSKASEPSETFSASRAG
jgi:hypothetical protein